MHYKKVQHRFTGMITSLKSLQYEDRLPVLWTLEERGNRADLIEVFTRSSAIAEGPRDASCQLKSCQLPRNNAETTYTTSPDQIDGMKLEI